MVRVYWCAVDGTSFCGVGTSELVPTAALVAGSVGGIFHTVAKPSLRPRVTRTNRPRPTNAFIADDACSLRSPVRFAMCWPEAKNSPHDPGSMSQSASHTRTCRAGSDIEPMSRVNCLCCRNFPLAPLARVSVNGFDSLARARLRRFMVAPPVLAP